MSITDKEWSLGSHDVTLEQAKPESCASRPTLANPDGKTRYGPYIPRQLQLALISRDLEPRSKAEEITAFPGTSDRC